jgi:AraC family transcriptional regulator
MEPRFEKLTEKKLVGRKLSMSLAADRTAELWRSFMPAQKEVRNRIGTELYSMQVYGPTYFTAFNPAAMFEKWATAEVSNFTGNPEGMKTFVLPGGLYAVFLHKGSNTDTSTFQYIFTTWLPASGYELDNRPHFEILGEKYRNGDPNSEEEIWIPVKPKA